ncbi:MAG: 2-amino-4-hydroxy-6-hydroxymethyldihydropteridine diphosphokinase [Litoreibacter sp.]|nr:2-amino-4-hydroxy-6-hydroxymethyldihydropteridine diphosphokinase [Litoreibacter sp.]MCY4333233.1 2-amino-4-hydroxy-6-hydroxymethyldihydropteridine diphosphokinase [Litoreibacter sp.]
MPQPATQTIVNKLCHIALGANATSSIGTPLLTIKGVILSLADDSLSISKVSRFYATPAFPAGSGPDFVNAVLEARTSLSATDLLARLHHVEAELGRERHERWGARVIDLDLLSYGDLIYPDRESFAYWFDLPLEAQKQTAPEGLILPHPRIQDRAFVLGPLCDIAPDWHHPVLGRSARELFDALPLEDRESLKPLKES